MTVAGLMPHAEMVHWWFAAGVLTVGLLMLAEAVVGPDVWRRRPWRRYLWPALCFLMGVLMWPVMTFYTNSTIHMLAHGSWAQVLMLAGAPSSASRAGSCTRRTGGSACPSPSSSPGRRSSSTSSRRSSSRAPPSCTMRSAGR